MTHAYNFQAIAAQDETLNFFSPNAPTLFTGESCKALGVFSREVLGRLDKNLASLRCGAGDERPVALWLKHKERGDGGGNSSSRLHAALFLHEDKLVVSQLSELSSEQQASLLETLGAFFLTENLCEALYQRAEFNIFHALDAVHFKEFSLLVGQPEEGDSGEFEEQLEGLGLDEETLGLRTCVHAACVREEEQKQQRNIERALELIHNTDLG